MRNKQIEEIKFYCWQLQIKTLKQMQTFKNKFKIKDNQTLLQKLAREYNGKTYNKLYFTN